jgi:ABC-type cobalt transport system, ATPase component
LLLKPKIILLDEPTKGIDAYSKTVLAGIIESLKAEGKTIVMVTHDVEFAAEYADRCAMFFDGKIVSVETPEIFFSENNYYTTSASRMSRGIFDRAVTAGQVIELCRLNGKRA